LVFYLDAGDGFVCDDPEATLARYRSYGAPVVFGAECRNLDPEDPPEKQWRFGNAGGFVGEAGIVANALREGFELQDWEQFGHISDQHAMLLYFRQREHRAQHAIDHRRLIVRNIPTGQRLPELEEHRSTLLSRSAPPTSSLHFYGLN